MKQLLLTAIASLGLLLSYGQQTINGTVVDTDNVPLIGANILVKATLTGTTTDLDGKFSLELPPGEQVLEISYTGYNSQEITVSPGQENLNVVMSFGQTLSEVVITGYGAQDRNSITGSVASVNAERIESFPIASIDQVLQGQAPGLIVLGGSGQPGSNNVSIVLRGPSTIQGSNNPIYIMDGIQISSKDFAALNINDIDEISILKDASSTAIYGASGANGVILITTKEGFDGKTKVSYNGQYGITSRARDRFDMMNSAQKLDFEALARRGPGWNLLPENPANAGLDETQLAANADQLEKLRNINTNWRDVVFRTGRTQSHNLGIRGGDNNTKFYFAGNYYQEDGVLRGSDFGRGTLRANFSEQVNDWMKIGIKASTGFSKSHQIQSENSINLNNPAALAYLINPYETVRDDDGNYTFGPTGRNPVEEAEFNYDETDVNKIVGQVYTEIEPLAGLKFTGRWGIDNTNVTSKDFIDPNSRLSTTVQGSQGQLDKNVAKTTWLTFSHVLNYKKIINDKHRFDILVGQETRKRNKDNYGFSVFGLTGGLESPAGATPGSAANPNFIPTTTGAVRKKILESYLARLNYTMDDKYNLTVGFRRDGNSVFGKNNKWGNFWNAGASWIVSRESFLQNNRVLNFLKLGISYGTNGNSEGIAEREQYTLYTNSSYAGGAAFIPSATNPGNPNLKWEVLKGFNAVVEFGLFKDRFFGNVAFYKNNTEDLFISQELPRSGGGQALTINAGSMTNQGVEVELSSKVLRGAAILELGVQFAYNKNEITDLGQVDEFEQGTSIIRKGLPLGSHYIEEWGGVDPATGNPLYVDANGNYTDNFSTVAPKAIFGSSFAPWSGGVTLDFSYKGFTLSALGSWVYGNVLFNNQTFFQENPNFAQFNLSTELLTTWKNPGDVTNVQRIGTARQFSSKDLEDGSFFRLRRITLGYQLPVNGKILNTFSRVRFYVQGKNLFTATKFTGFDPEVSNNISTYGFPASKIVNVGVNLDF